MFRPNPTNGYLEYQPDVPRVLSVFLALFFGEIRKIKRRNVTETAINAGITSFCHLTLFAYILVNL